METRHGTKGVNSAQHRPASFIFVAAHVDWKCWCVRGHELLQCGGVPGQTRGGNTYLEASVLALI
ncbi:hypothetical protein E2C01_040662 [Portunus trituberculatus]|uniref:Uncharacterized protein n=1 Tax=Portunus trituberculatus TaxID=210409 RepID=A0A5B7FI04_PORTR|nr:hypothetical protein [Portunus trituberculatus]